MAHLNSCQWSTYELQHIWTLHKSTSYRISYNRLLFELIIELTYMIAVRLNSQCNLIIEYCFRFLSNGHIGLTNFSMQYLQFKKIWEANRGKRKHNNQQKKWWKYVEIR
jgi:hypothetical protein